MSVFRQTIRRLALAAVFGSACMGTAALAQTAAATDNKDSAAAGQCAVRDRSPAIVVMVCAPDAKPDQWRAAAIAACGPTRNRCNVWIWDSAAQAPTKAPVLDADLPRELAGKAVAVWAHDTQSLLQIRKPR